MSKITHSKTAAATLLMILVVFAGCNKTKDPVEARKELGHMNIAYNEETFIESAKNGDIVAVNLFLAAGMNPNVRHPQGKIVYLYTDREVKDVASLLMEQQLAIARGDKIKGMTALMVASYFGRVEVVKALLSSGADVDAVDTVGLTAQKYAAMQGHDDIVGLLGQKTKK